MGTGSGSFEMHKQRGSRMGMHKQVADKPAGVFVALGLLVFGLGVGADRLQAQATATVLGTITDTSGAVLAEAVVQVRNVGTGITQSGISDSQGRFQFPDLAIGD